MSKTYNNRYLRDSNGDIYLPMTSIDCIVDIDKINNVNNFIEINSKISELKDTVKVLSNSFEELKERINKLESEGTK